MNTREYLSQLYRLNQIIDSNIAEVQRLRLLCESIPTTDFSRERVSGGVHENKIAGLIGKAVDLETEIQAEIDSYIDLEREVRDVINAHENITERLLLRLRYIEFNTWERIAEKMNYSTMQIWRIHGSALKNLKIPDKCY